MTAEHFERWKTITYNNELSSFIEENQDVINKFIYRMYFENKKKKNFGIITYNNEQKLQLSVHEYIIGKNKEFDEKMSRVNFSSQCPLIFNVLNNNIASYNLIRYPHEITLNDASDTIEYFYDENGPYIPNFNMIKNKSKNIYTSLYFGEVREKLLKISLTSQVTEGVISITCPSEFSLHKTIALQFIPKSIAIDMAETTGFREHIDLFSKFNVSTDVFVMFSISYDNENSWYLPIILTNFKFLKNMNFRKKLFDRILFKDDTPNIILDNIILGLSIFGYISHKILGGHLIDNIGTLWDNKDRISKKVKDNIKTKISQYKCNDSKKNKNTYELSLDDIIKIFISYNFRCDECGREVMIDHRKDCYLQYSIDRIDDSKPHSYDNIRLTCLSCNISHRKNMFMSNTTVYPSSSMYYIECKSCPNHKQSYIYEHDSDS
jgi:hypothetical protein